jgi:hypothetical protein
VDGDLVTVSLSQPLLSAANVDAVFQFNAGTVNASTSNPQLLQKLDLKVLAAVASTRPGSADQSSAETTATRG